MKKNIKVALVGAGYMAKEHLRAFREIESVTFTGITSRTMDKCTILAKEFGIQKICNSIDELWKSAEPDVLIVTVPELSARSVCLQAFQFPWKILMEKPAGYDLKDSQAICDAAKAKNRDVFVALNRRYYSSSTQLLAQLDQEKGSRLIRINDQEDARAALKAGQPELVVNNWMYANSIHLIDLFRFYGRGEVTKVENMIPWKGIDSDYVASKISFSSGDIGLYTAVWNRPSPWSVTICSEGKYFEQKPIEALGVQVYGSRKLEPVAIHDWDLNFKPGLRFMAEDVINFLHGKANHLVPLAESHKSMELVSKIYDLR